MFESRWLYFTAKGHPNVRATHKSTLELTRDPHLTPRGDCIVGVEAELSAGSLPQWIKMALRREDSLLIVVLCSGGVCDSLTARGDPRLTLASSNSMVIRKSSYVDARTIGVGASKAARDIDRRIVESLRGGGTLNVYMTVITRPPSV
ncbi:MAG: DUF371 domain-containing protein [Desulfurococcales archaeon]|nr:DUF371 domain-containing protein [Desulfurococcales archaeon]